MIRRARLRAVRATLIRLGGPVFGPTERKGLSNIYNIYVSNNCINDDECLSKSSKNKVFQQHGHAGKLDEKAC